MNLNRKERQILLNLAAMNIREQITGRKDDADINLPPTLEMDCGVFVSVYVEGKLRGCIGTFSEERGLVSNVREMAVAAASSDSRFTPIKMDELEQLYIEISVLSPRRRIYDISEIEPGRHGIYLVYGSRRGTLLPQVASKQGWDAETFLEHCARYKAGLAPGEWKYAEIYTYEAQVFNSDQ